MIPLGYPEVVQNGIEALRWVTTLQRHLLTIVPGDEGVLQAIRNVEDLLDRMSRRTDEQWRTGAAAAFFTPVDLALIQGWSESSVALPLVPEGTRPEQRQLQSARFRALHRWMGEYLD